MKTISINEVAHSIFYAPFYVAMKRGYFEREGIRVNVETGMGSDKVMESLLNGKAEVGLMGPETTLYLYEREPRDQVISFAQLTSRAGNFLVARNKEEVFKWKDIKNKNILGDKKDSLSGVMLDHLLRKNGIDPEHDVTIDQSIPSGQTTAAFIEGKGDYACELEPDASLLEENYGFKVVAALGMDSGFVPYTAFCSRESFLKKHASRVQAFTNAVQRGMTFTAVHTAEDIASVISGEFPELTLKQLKSILQRYKEQEVWDDDLIFRSRAYRQLQRVLMSEKRLALSIPYEEVVNTVFAKSACYKFMKR